MYYFAITYISDHLLPMVNRDDEGPIKYGATIAIKSAFARERLLGVRDNFKLSFARHLVGQGEKWTIYKSTVNNTITMNSSNLHASVHTINTGSKGMHSFHNANNFHISNIEDTSARNTQYIRIGDNILLQTYKSDHFLSVHDFTGGHINTTSGNNNTTSTTGSDIRLVYRERSSFGNELFQIELFHAVPLPTWMITRPYLSGKYLKLSPLQRMTTPEIESRVFPKNIHQSASEFIDITMHIQQPITDLELQEQHVIFMRDLLLVLSGAEGNYIRVAANTNTNATSNKFAANTTAMSTLTTESVKLTIDLEAADRSTASKVKHSIDHFICLLTFH